MMIWGVSTSAQAYLGSDVEKQFVRADIIL